MKAYLKCPKCGRGPKDLMIDEVTRKVQCAKCKLIFYPAMEVEVNEVLALITAPQKDPELRAFAEAYVMAFDNTLLEGGIHLRSHRVKFGGEYNV